MDQAQEIKRRYFRQVIGHPDGAIVHHGDCEIYAVYDGMMGHCDCGLHHDLQILGDERVTELYPKYYDELAKVGRRYDEKMSKTSELHGEDEAQ